jgi:RNA polymerase sigma-70 factor (ECF subfamily)
MAFCTPFPWNLDLSPSLSSSASCSPVEAPEGTSADPLMPSSVVTVTWRVGQPLESRTSQASHIAIFDFSIFPTRVMILIMIEKDLIEKSKRGDEEAFGALFSLYRDKIYQHSLGILKDEESAQDVTQEAFVHAYRHLKEFRSDSSFYTWIYRIAHNLSLNELKKKGRHKEEEFNEAITPGGASEEESLEKREVEEALKMAVGSLSERHRIVYELCELERLPQKEVAERLNIPEGTVRSRLFYARKQVRSYIQDRV